VEEIFEVGLETGQHGACEFGLGIVLRDQLAQDPALPGGELSGVA
jgi:hypothetical protein